MHSAKSTSSTFSVLFDTLTKFMGYEQQQDAAEDPSARMESLGALAVTAEEQGSSVDVQSDRLVELKSVRQDTVSSIAEILMNNRRNVTDDLIEVIYPVAKNIEGKLFRKTSSAEEYADKETLPDRVRAVLRKEMQVNASETEEEAEADKTSSASSDAPVISPRHGGAPRQHPLASSTAGQSFTWPNTHTSQVPPSELTSEAQMPTGQQGKRQGAKVRGRPPSLPRYYEFPEHAGERNSVIGEIVRLLQTKSSNATQNWRSACPYLCERLEAAMFRQAKNMEEYADLATVQQRMTRFITLGGSKKPTQLKVVKSVEGSGEPDSPVYVQSSVRKKSPKKAKTSSPVVSGAGKAIKSSSPIKEKPKDLLYQQQQRILMLQHASRCNLLEGACPQPHCWSMQKLWKHVTQCSQPKCPTPHCVSSRYVMAHYSKCNDQACRMCAPARQNRQAEAQKGQRTSRTAAPTDDSITSLDKPAVSPKKRKAGLQGVTSKENVINYRGDTANPTLTKRRLSDASMGSAGGGASVSSAHSATSASQRVVTPQTISGIFIPIIERILREPYAHSCFGAPVDPVAMNLPDYFEVIKIPMDLGTVLQGLREDHYTQVQALVDDVHLTFDNAKLFNGASSQVGGIAKRLQSRFNEMSRKPRMELSQLVGEHSQQGLGKQQTSFIHSSGGATGGAAGGAPAKPFTIYDQPSSDQAKCAEGAEFAADPNASPSTSTSAHSGHSAGGEAGCEMVSKVRHARAMSPTMTH